MGKRVLVAVVGVPFLLLVLIWAPDWATLLLVTALCGVGAYELMHAVTSGNGKRQLILGTVEVALAIPLFLYWTHAIYAEYPPQVYCFCQSILPMVMMIFLVLLFVYSITGYGKARQVSFADVTASIFAGLVFPLMLSCLLRLRLMDNGTVYVMLPLAVSFGSDTLALFAGMLFGKHKLAPLVSPKKTVEGGLGGLLGGVLGMLVVKWIAEPLTAAAFSYGFCVLTGLVGSVISQIGDLSFSVIKREFGIKDYGKLLPGHGGVLDRFDSVTFAAPFLWLLLSYMK